METSNNITKREFFACMAMQALIVGSSRVFTQQLSAHNTMKKAVLAADLLIEALQPVPDDPSPPSLDPRLL